MSFKSALMAEINQAIVKEAVVPAAASAKAYRAGLDFIGELNSAVDSCAALSDKAKAPFKTGKIDGPAGFAGMRMYGGKPMVVYNVGITVDDGGRPSVDPETWGDGVYSIVDLLEDGYHAGGAVKYEEGGKEKWTRRAFGGAHVIKDTASSFKGHKGDGYIVLAANKK